MKDFDVLIIGAGIVGLATAYQLSRKNPKLTIGVLDKETEVARHQTGHNSGVIHSGIYYKPGSLKAINCREGYRELLQFCKEHAVAHEVCGKVIVATRESEFDLLQTIYNRGLENGMEGLKIIGPEELKDIEPHVSGLRAIRVPQAGIIDYKDVAIKYQELIEKAGGNILLGHTVKDIRKSGNNHVVITSDGEFQTSLVVNCAGLYSDKITRLTMRDVDLKIIPFRGEYYKLKPERQYLVNHLVYPVPNPAFPFLGVHFTRMIKGGIEAGPNAVLAFRREGYRKRDINLAELGEILFYPGFAKIAKKYWKDGWAEMRRSFSKTAFTQALQRLIPEIVENDLEKGGAGVRAQACDADGNLIDDFLIYEAKGVINVCNAPSPAATASLAIGSAIANRIIKRF